MCSTAAATEKGCGIMAAKLAKSFHYYIQHQKELVKKYSGKFIVLIDNKVIGAYDSELEAIKETLKNHELGTFLVQKCEPGTENISRTFHSRISLK